MKVRTDPSPRQWTGRVGLEQYHQQNIPTLAKHFRVLALDMIGWGGSDPVKYNERDNAEGIIQFIEALGIEKAALVGNPPRRDDGDARGGTPTGSSRRTSSPWVPVRAA